MTIEGTHIIRKGHLKLKMSDRAHALDIQSQVLDLFQGPVMAMLEKEFDQWASDGQVIQIDRLELDIGRLSLDNMAEELPRLIRKKFQETFLKVIAAEYGQESASKLKIRTTEEADMDTLMQFLETGRMNWDVALQENKAVLILENLLKTQSDTVIKVLTARLAEPGLRVRLCLQFPASILDRLLMLMAPADYQVWRELIITTHQGAMQWLSALQWPSWSPELAVAMIYNRVFAMVSEHSLSPDPSSLLWQVLQEGTSTGRISVRQLEARIQNASAEKLIEICRMIGRELANVANNLDTYLRTRSFNLEEYGIVIPLLQKWIIDHVTGNFAGPRLDGIREDVLSAVAIHQLSVQEHVATAILGPVGGLGGATGRNLPHSEREVSPDRQLKAIHGKADARSLGLDILRHSEQEIYVNNAGLVLLNPFFSHCFEDLGWMEGGEFIDEASREHAVLLSAYMACGQMEISEEKLPLAKLLCGMDLDRPVRATLDMPIRAIEEADALLVAANGHWEKAGKLTPAQFREAFLLREGRLTIQSSGWEIKVDRHTIDILLEFIPWSYGTIKLPWMSGVLTVDW